MGKACEHVLRKIRTRRTHNLNQIETFDISETQNEERYLGEFGTHGSY